MTAPVTHIGSASPDRRMQAAAGLREWADRVQRGEVESIGLVVIHGTPPLAHIAYQNVLDGAERLRVLGAVRILDEVIARQVWEEMSERDPFAAPEDGA